MTMAIIAVSLLIQYFGGMQFDEDNKSEEGENIQDLLDDLGLGDDAANFQASRKDSTYMLNTLQGEQKCQLEIILQAYYNFLQRKIIANAQDKVGLIFYNVENSQNSINQDHIFKVHSLASEVDAKRIKDAGTLYRDFNARFKGISKQRVSLNYVLWEYGAEIGNLKPTEFYLRLFLFTAEDNPHPLGDEDRQPSIKRAQELAAKNVQIELFPVKKSRTSVFDIRLFYQQIMTIDPEDINATTLDSSSKILNIQERLRQKEFKKRTLNRLTMKIGKEVNQDNTQKPVQIGVKIYSLFTKAKKPSAKKVDAKTNKLLQRVTKKMNSKGQILFDGVVGTYYPLGGEKVKITKEDMIKIKNLQNPGMTLVGFKPRNLIKPFHNLRTSYFLYPDEQHISGSSQFFDGLINELTEKGLVGIIKLVPRNNQQLRFAALYPQAEKYDQDDHFQTPPGFNMVILPFADDIVNFIGNKTVVKPAQVSQQLIQVTKLLINNLTIHDFDFRQFQNPSLQKFYAHLQAHALNEKDVEIRPDLLEPDIEGFNNFRDVIEMVKEAVMMEVEGPAANYQRSGTPGFIKEQDESEPNRRNKTKKESAKVKTQYAKLSSRENALKEEQNNVDLIAMVQSQLMNANLKDVRVADLKTYLKIHGMNDNGKKQVLIDRILDLLNMKNSI